ncbi:hypothetical protein Nisw_08915 [Candidatus Nitrosopumilus sp. SW]|uniref:hypothetical protein n=1 Tax=Candidatus Nitrosopumilus sp. SW TaxID=2508726 RepID=UPI00114EF5AB|nr:hypothetical protein [Candidatus Nitrosopumilus sp. SW]QDI89634.1 hypothetical protein Nisw_08915 [Candidatus Nitrosopumilus sp. SW]
MKNVSKKPHLTNRRAVSQVMGSIVILGIVTSVGSVILFNGMGSISAFTYDLSFHEKSKNEIHREYIIFEHIRFVPNDDNIEIDLANIGTVESTISNITILKIDTQEIIANWVDVEETIHVETNQKIILDSTDISLTNGFLTQTWDDDYYYYVNGVPSNGIAKYKISLTTVKGNFFTTVASPFNT